VIRLAEKEGEKPSPPSPNAATLSPTNDLRGDSPGDGSVTVAPPAGPTVTEPSPDRHSPNVFIQKDLGMTSDGGDGGDGRIPTHSVDPATVAPAQFEEGEI
jgi:hypothetical protein